MSFKSDFEGNSVINMFVEEDNQSTFLRGQRLIVTSFLVKKIFFSCMFLLESISLFLVLMISILLHFSIA